MNSSSDDFLDLKGTVALMRRQLRLFMMAAIIVLGVALGYLFVVTPLYTATTLVLVDPARKNLLDPTRPTATSSGVENARIESQAAILNSDKVLLETIKRLGLLSKPEFGPTIGLGEKIKRVLGFRVQPDETGRALVNETLARFSGSTVVRRKGLTYLIRVSVSSRNPSDAALYANTLAKTYIDLQIQSKVSSALASRDILQGLIVDARQKLATSEEALNTFIDSNLDRLARKNAVGDVGALRNAMSQANVARLSAKITASEAEKARTRQDWNSLSKTLGDDALSVLANQRARLERLLANTSANSSDKINLRARLARLEQGLSGRADMAIGSLRDTVTKLDSEASDYRTKMRQLAFQGNLAPGILAEIYELQQESDISQRQYGTLLSRLRDTERQALVQVADARIVSEAIPPRTASSPNTQLILGSALILALALGTGLAFVNEYHIGGITSTSQLSNIIAAKLVTSVPHQSHSETQTTVADLIIDAPLSTYSEALRHLRAAIDQGAQGASPGGKVIMVTSSIPAEGKTSLALALARTYSQADKSTLLIDADLRKPRLFKYLEIIPKFGLLGYLRGQGKLAELPQFYAADPKSTVGVILGNERRDIPTDQLLQSDRFTDLVAKARATMAVTIIDTPPIGPIVDARYVAPLADAVILCVRFGVTSQNDLRQSYANLLQIVRPGTPILAVLSHDETKQNAYRYHEYYNDDATA